MRLSASSEVEGIHLVACPHCGALNGRTATQCWKCDQDLATPDLLEPPPAPRPTPKSHGGWWPSPPDTTSEPPKPSAPPPPETPPPAAPAPVAADTPAPPPDVPPATVPPEAEAGVPAHIWAFADSTSFADHAATLRRQRRRVVSAGMLALGGALAVAAYFLFRPAAVGDAGWHVAAPAVAPQQPHPAASAPVAAVPTEIVASPPPQPEPSAAAGPVTSTLTRPAPIKRDAGRGKAGDEEPPPHPGPCTPQIAALGLCKLEPKP